ELLGPGAETWRPRAQSLTVMYTRIALMCTALTWIGFTAIAGAPGMYLYLAATLGVVFGVQLITYIQHWGLGDDSIPGRIAYGRGWEDDCRFQAWVTLSLSLHDQHHRDSRRPFYRIGPSPDSPRLPAGYVLLMFASLVPPVWRRVMATPHQYWLASPASPLSAGHRLTCFGLREPWSNTSA
ncbi:MAG: fatty acid desaturase, partial [Rhizobacter sp.]|nr:fatty acid desaturase [Rhizobacter sp.]